MKQAFSITTIIKKTEDDNVPCGAQCHVGESRGRGETTAMAMTGKEARREGMEPMEIVGLSFSRT